jgi:uncharacterized Fe-S center protein
MAVILKNNKLLYIVLNFSEYNEIHAVRQKFINATVDNVIAVNLRSLKTTHSMIILTVE